MTIERGTGRPKNGYRLKDGTKPQSASGIAQWFCETFGPTRLDDWKIDEALAGRDPRGDSPATRIGSLAHDMIEEEIHGGDGMDVFNDAFVVDEFEAKQSLYAYRSWLEWRDSHPGAEVEYLATEVPLVSETYRIAGTLDALATARSKHVVFDWKTSGGFHGKVQYAMQCALYSLIWEDVRGELITEGRIVRLAKSPKHHAKDGRRFELIQIEWPDINRLRKAYLKEAGIRGYAADLKKRLIAC